MCPVVRVSTSEQNAKDGDVPFAGGQLPAGGRLMKSPGLSRDACVALSSALLFYSFLSAHAADWPMWRHDAGNTGVTPEALPADLHVQWVRELPAPRPAWPRTQWDLHFDFSYEPVVMGKMLLVPSMVSDSVTAYDTDTGAEKWRFYADGPVRFAPVAANGRIWFGSDDGYLYCLNAKDGSLLWKVRGGPDERNVIGNGRLIGMWPIRGAPVLYDGPSTSSGQARIYFAAGIWPFMGIFIHAVDAETGKVVWTNSGTGAMHIAQPHGSPAFAGVAPQGYVAATSDKIVVPGGRTAPAVFERSTGKLLYFNLLRSKAAGYDVRVHEGNKVFDIRGHIHSLGHGYCSTWSSLRSEYYYYSSVFYHLDHKGGITATHDKKENLWEVTIDVPLKKMFIQAGPRIYCSDGAGAIVALDANRETAAISWRGKVQGTAWSMLAADGKLFVITEEGGIYCFGGQRAEPRKHAVDMQELPAVSDAWTSRARKILDACTTREGYCLALGIGSSRLVEEILAQSSFRVVVVDPGKTQVEAFRRRMDAAGLYGRRVVARVGDPFGFPFPAYLADLIVSEDPRSAGLDPQTKQAESIFKPLRPYGGVARLAAGQQDAGAMQRWLQQANLEKADISLLDGFVVLGRPGPLPGSADWTHQNADAANSLVSRDNRVKAPLGLLWFGGPSNDKVLPRHGHGPSPQVVDGRLFIEGPHVLRCVDVYTGRVLWEREFKDLGRFYDDTRHQAGAGEIGGNYVSMPDGIYVVRPRSCLRLDPVTGKTIKEFTLPAPEGGEAPHWGFIAVWNDLLIATASPLHIGYPVFPKYTSKEREQIEIAARTLMKPDGVETTPLEDIENVGLNADYSSASQALVVMDRHSGRILWSRKAHYAFRHNAVAVGKGRVFCIDRMSHRKMAYLARRGLDFSEKPVLYALDARTGQVIWKTGENVFGTWLAYSEEHDALVQTVGGGSKDRPLDETQRGLAVYEAGSGKVFWQSDVSVGAPCMLYHDWILHNRGAFALLTAKSRMWTNPLTGKEEHWRVSRGYGCGTMIAGEHLLSFRSSAAGFYDLTADSGTANLGGFKSGCTANMIPANGVLNAPDYTRTCVCNFQNQTSLAMIHDPSAEVWTFTPYEWDGDPVRRVGINLGAPGDRLAQNGTLWMDFPSVGGKSPDIPVTVEGEQPEYFRHHSLLMQGTALRWVAGSGVTGARQVTLTLAEDEAEPRPHTVRLVFSEPDQTVRPGDRAFDVSLQGQPVMEGFDIVKAARGCRSAVVKEFQGISVATNLTISLGAKSGDPVLCGVEVVATPGEEKIQ